MFAINSLFVMSLIALAMRRLPKREWFSSLVVIFVLGLCAIACQDSIEGLLRGVDIGTGPMIGVFSVLLTSCIGVKAAWDDLFSSPEMGSPRKSSRSAVYRITVNL